MIAKFQLQIYKIARKIPCHRVIQANGKLGGYNKGIKKKIKLLNLENSLNSHSFQKSKDF